MARALLLTTALLIGLAGCAKHDKIASAKCPRFYTGSLICDDGSGPGPEVTFGLNSPSLTVRTHFSR